MIDGMCFDGPLNLGKLIWKGGRMKAPDTSPMEVNVEATKATSGGRKTRVFTPDKGKLRTDKPYSSIA